MKNAIPNMTLAQIKLTKEKISLSSAPRNVKSELYALCEEREKALNVKTALVEQAEVKVGEVG